MRGEEQSVSLNTLLKRARGWGRGGGGDSQLSCVIEMDLGLTSNTVPGGRSFPAQSTCLKQYAAPGERNKKSC